MENKTDGKSRSRIITEPDDNIEPIAISIGNRKGGVGKTTVCFNAANELSKGGYKLVLLDLDSQKDLSDLSLNSKFEYNIYDIFQGKAILNEAIYEIEDADGQMIIPGSNRLDEIGTKIKQSLDLIIDELKELFDVVLIDHPPGLSQISKTGYALSDYLVIVTEPSNLSINNVNSLINDDLVNIAEEFNRDINICGIVANKVDMRRNITKRALNQLNKEFPQLIFDDYISIDTAVPNSQVKSLPVRNLKWRSRTVSQFERVSQNIVKRCFDDLFEKGRAN